MVSSYPECPRTTVTVRINRAVPPAVIENYSGSTDTVLSYKIEGSPSVRVCSNTLQRFEPEGDGSTMGQAIELIYPEQTDTPVNDLSVRVAFATRDGKRAWNKIVPLAELEAWNPDTDFRIDIQSPDGQTDRHLNVLLTGMRDSMRTTLATGQDVKVHRDGVRTAEPYYQFLYTLAGIHNTQVPIVVTGTFDNWNQLQPPGVKIRRTQKNTLVADTRSGTHLLVSNADQVTRVEIDRSPSGPTQITYCVGEQERETNDPGRSFVLTETALSQLPMVKPQDAR